MIKKADMEILVKAVGLFKEYEHDTKFKISGKDIDELVKKTEIYLKTLKELRKQIEKRSQEKTIEQIYGDVFGLLKAVMGKKSQAILIDNFEKEFVNKGKFTNHHLRILNDLVKARADFKKGKLNLHKVEEARKNASILINDLIDYNQRCELANGKKE